MNDLDRVEAQAFREIVTLSGGRTEVAGGVLCMSHPTFNWAIPIGMDIDAEAVLRWFDGAEHQFSAPSGLDLAPYGYTAGYGWMKFERGDDPAPAVETELRIEETSDRATFAHVLAEGMGAPEPMDAFVGAPGFRCFLAWDGDEPAACGALYADGGTAWLGIAATRPESRGRGAQRALLAARIDAARAAGARRMTTETGERVDGRPDQSYRNILRAGFREGYVRPNWQSPR